MKKNKVAEAVEAALHAHFATLGKAGGKTRAERLTPAERQESARKAAKARWEAGREVERQPERHPRRLHNAADAESVGRGGKPRKQR